MSAPEPREDQPEFVGGPYYAGDEERDELLGIADAILHAERKWEMKAISPKDFLPLRDELREFRFGFKLLSKLVDAPDEDPYIYYQEQLSPADVEALHDLGRDLLAIEVPSADEHVHVLAPGVSHLDRSPGYRLLRLIALEQQGYDEEQRRERVEKWIEAQNSKADQAGPG